MIVRTQILSPKLQAADGPKITSNFLRVVFMLPDENMDVVRHNRTGVAGIAVLLNRSTQRIGDDGKILPVGNPAAGVSAPLARSRNSLIFAPSRLLELFTAVVQLAQLRNHVAGDRF